MHLVHDALHAAQLLVHLGGDVLAVHHAGSSLGQPQGPMHRRPALGGIHRLTAKQSVDPVGQVLLARQREQSVDRLLGQALLGVIEQQRAAISVQALEALRIIGEKLRQMGVLDVIGMLSQDPPHITYSPDMDRTEAVLLQQNQNPRPANRRSTRPGCEWAKTPIVRAYSVRTEGGAPTAKTETNPAPYQTNAGPRTVGAPAPGANACQTGSHRGGAPTSKPGFFSNRRSTRPGCEWVPTFALSRNR